MLLQEIFPTQGSNLGLLHCRQTLYHLSHQGSSKKAWIDINAEINNKKRQDVDNIKAALVVKNPPAKAGGVRDLGSSWVRKVPWRREWQPTPVFLPGEPHGQRSLVGYSPRGRQASDMTKQLMHTDQVSLGWGMWPSPAFTWVIKAPFSQLWQRA